jgi:hypothetical protein
MVAQVCKNVSKLRNDDCKDDDDDDGQCQLVTKNELGAKYV